MMKFNKLFLFSIIAFTLAFAFAGCSGGGGGGGGDDAGLVYSGLTTPATFTDSNAEEISGGALGAGLVGDGMMGLPAPASVNQGSSEYHTKNFRSVQVPLILRDSLDLVDFTSSGGVQATIHSESETIHDSCDGDGSMSYTASYNDVTGVFSGNFIFINYGCGETQINGSASFSGVFDGSDFVSATFTFNNITGGDLALHGTLSIDYSESPNVITFNACGQDPISGKIFKIENYTINLYDRVGYVEIEMTGTFYDPDFGYVNISTDQIFVLQEIDEWPSDGILIITGSNSKVRLTALTNTTCSVEGDFDGDDNYEWTQPEIDWADL